MKSFAERIREMDEAHDAIMQEWDESIARADEIISRLDLGDNQRMLDQELKYEIEEREIA